MVLPEIPYKELVERVEINGQVEILAFSDFVGLKPEFVYKLNAGYSLNRFNTGHLLDEKGLGTKTWIS